MLRILASVLLAMMVMRPVLAWGPGIANDPQSAEARRVLVAEDAYVAAEVNRDEDALQRIVDKRFVFNTLGGETLGKVELIDAVLKLNMTGQTLSERTVLVEGNVALIFGTTEIRSALEGQEDKKTVYRYTSTYVKRGEEWKFLALQMVARAP